MAARGRPKITIRMDPEEIVHLKDVAKLYGTDVASFAREMFQAILSPDVNHRLAWVHGLAAKLGEQLTLPLTESARAVRAPRKPRKKRRPRDGTT